MHLASEHGQKARGDAGKRVLFLEDQPGACQNRDDPGGPARIATRHYDEARSEAPKGPCNAGHGLGKSCEDRDIAGNVPTPSAALDGHEKVAR